MPQMRTSLAFIATLALSSCLESAADVICGETDAQFCARLGATCGAVSATNLCGEQRTIASCGQCAADQTCDSHNHCGDCGDAAVRSRYATCIAARDEVACSAAGGSWVRVGLDPSPTCSCPTGQGKCACTSSSQCLGMCTAQPNSMPGTQGPVCPQEGHCSEWTPNVGCFCTDYNGSKLDVICVD